MATKKTKKEYYMSSLDKELTHEEYVNRSQALKLKALEFHWHCYGAFATKVRQSWILSTPMDHNNFDSSVCSAPTLAQAQRWLRDIKNIYLIVDVAYKETYDADASYYWRTCDQMGWKLENSQDNDAYFDTYEQALSAGIDRVLETLKEKQK